jgi:hypothetical protein
LANGLLITFSVLFFTCLYLFLIVFLLLRAFKLEARFGKAKPMKKLSLSVVLTAVALVGARADTLANWTFETASASITGTSTVLSGIAADSGSGTASGLHASAAAWSSPAGNGSTHSFSVNTWTVGDYFQFQVGTSGFQGITVSYDQISSSTGPGIFKLGYSTDGVNFTFGSDYTVLANASPNTWSSGSPVNTTTFSQNLSALLALNNAGTVFFRLVDDATTSASQANGGATAPSTAGTDRVDNFVVNATPIPEPSTVVLGLWGGLTGLFALRRKP